MMHELISFTYSVWELQVRGSKKFVMHKAFILNDEKKNQVLLKYLELEAQYMKAQFERSAVEVRKCTESTESIPASRCFPGSA